MKTLPGLPTQQPLRRRNSTWPNTRLGWWSLGLAATFAILMFINSAIFMRLPEAVTWRVTVLPVYGIFMMVCGLAAGIVGLFAVMRQHERSWLVGLAILPGLLVLVFVLGEFLVPH